MEEIANIYTNAKQANAPLNKTNKNDIVYKIKELGQHGSIDQLYMSASSGNTPVGTRSAVVMAMFIAFVSTENTKIPASIEQLNEALKLFLEIDYPLIKDSSDTQRYLKEAREFINEGYKSVSSYATSPRSQLHEIFCKMGGSKQTSLTSSAHSTGINYFARTNVDLLLTKDQITRIARAIASTQTKTVSDIKVDPEQFVLTLHKFPERFGEEEADATVIFKAQDTTTRVAITTLIYKHKEYNYLAKKHSYLFDIATTTPRIATMATSTSTSTSTSSLNENEKLQVRKNICKHAIYQRFTFDTINSAVSFHHNVEKEEDKKALETMIKGFNPFADSWKSVADNTVSQINAAVSKDKTLIINNFINYIFNEREGVASDTDALSNQTSFSNPSTGASKEITQSHLTKTNSNFNNNNYHGSNPTGSAASEYQLLDIDESSSDSENEGFPTTSKKGSPSTVSTQNNLDLTNSNFNNNNLKSVIPSDLLLSKNSISITLDKLNNSTSSPNDDEITLIIPTSDKKNITDNEKMTPNNSPTNNGNEMLIK